MDNNEVPVWMKRKEPEKENATVIASDSINGYRKDYNLHIISIGDVGIRMAENAGIRTATKPVAISKDQIPLTCIEDSNPKELTISIGKSEDKLLLYDPSEVQMEWVRKFATVAKLGGRVIACEMCEHWEATHTASQVGVDVLIHTTSPAECKLALSALWHMVLRNGEITADMDDFFDTFCEDDYVMVNLEECEGINGWLKAARKTAAHWENATDTPDSYLLSFSSNEQMMDLMSIQKLSKIIMADEHDNERAVWEVCIEDEPEDIVRIITFAGMKSSPSEKIASEGTLCDNIIYQDRVTQLVRDYVTSAHTGGNVIPPEKLPQVFLGFRVGLSSLLNGSSHSIEE